MSKYSICTYNASEQPDVINWAKYFDHIYCIHYLPYQDRLEPLKKELNRVGILNSGIFEFYWTYPYPFYNIIRKTSVLKNILFVNGNVKATTNLALTNYRIMKEAYDQDYQRVLVLEDDVLFLHDICKIKEMLEHMPEEWDFIQFDRAYPNEHMKHSPYSDYYCCDYHGGYTSAACNAYTKKGLQAGITLMEQGLYVNDRLLANNKDADDMSLKRYVATYNIVKQDNRDYDDGYRPLLDFNDFYPRLA